MLRTLRHIRYWNVLFKSNALLKFFVIRLFPRYLAHLYNSPLFHCLLDPCALLESSFIWLFPKYLAHLLLYNKTNKNLCIPRIFPYLIVLLESRAKLKLSSLLDISIASLEFYSILFLLQSLVVILYRLSWTWNSHTYSLTHSNVICWCARNTFGLIWKMTLLFTVGRSYATKFWWISIIFF